MRRAGGPGGRRRGARRRRPAGPRSAARHVAGERRPGLPHAPRVRDPARLPGPPGPPGDARPAAPRRLGRGLPGREPLRPRLREPAPAQARGGRPAAASCATSSSPSPASATGSAGRRRAGRDLSRRSHPERSLSARRAWTRAASWGCGGRWGHGAPVDPDRGSDRATALEREMAPRRQRHRRWWRPATRVRDAARRPRLRRRAPRPRPALAARGGACGSRRTGGRRGGPGPRLRAGRGAGRGTSRPSGTILLVEDDDRCDRSWPAISGPAAGTSPRPTSAEEAAAALARGPPPVARPPRHQPAGRDRLGPAPRRRPRRPPVPPVVVVTATTIGPRRLREFGVAGYLPKPFALETLLEVCERFVASRLAAEGLERGHERENT